MVYLQIIHYSCYENYLPERIKLVKVLVLSLPFGALQNRLIISLTSEKFLKNCLIFMILTEIK